MHPGFVPLQSSVSLQVSSDAGHIKNSAFFTYGETIIDRSLEIQAMKRILSGIFVTVVGGVVVWYIIQELNDNRPSPEPSPSPIIPTTNGPIIVTASVNPPVISVGQQTMISVYAQDSQGLPLPFATVTVSAGGGRFNRTGTSTASGPTDSSGVFRAYWSCDPCSWRYTNSVRVTKPGYQEANAQWQVDIQ